MTYQDSIQKLQDEQLTPNELSAIRMFLAAEYGRLSTLLVEILSRKPAVWMRLREASESDKQADRKWDASADGLAEMSYRWTMKAVEKNISAIKTRLEVLAVEARNQY